MHFIRGIFTGLMGERKSWQKGNRLEGQNNVQSGRHWKGIGVKKKFGN